jgi:hypothetical protein
MTANFFASVNQLIFLLNFDIKAKIGTDQNPRPLFGNWLTGTLFIAMNAINY